MPFRNGSCPSDFVSVVAWLLATLRSRGPDPVLAISGEQGSAKTVLSKLLRALVDPNVAPVRALAREERELMIAANNGHLLAFDNLSGLPVRIPTIATTHSDGSRPSVPIDRDQQCGAGAEGAVG